MAESSCVYADSRVSSDLDPLSDDEDFVSSASTTSVGTEERPVEKERINLEMLAASDGHQLIECTRSMALSPSVIDNNHNDNDVGRLGLDLASFNAMNDRKAKEVERKQLNLLDLPVDLLQDIIKEVTHTNDLTSLALTCSALHSLAIPQMYSRFDIVWPDTFQQSDHPAGVDALSYGLATLVMGEDIFREAPQSLPVDPCPHCGCHNRHTPAHPGPDGIRQVRRGNYFAQYTRKFSVGNGPSDWVQEYSVIKETGKMLGTLVALAVARMVNLETFIWDMPTGVVRDVWIALSSLATRPGHECRLQNVWIRWHDNSQNTIPSLPVVPTASSLALPETQNNLPPSPPVTTSTLQRKYGHVEYPSLSILPSLRNLSVLDIDESSYLEEMAVLIERSRTRLKELRVGISSKVYQADWLKPSGSSQSEDDAPIANIAGWPKHGGILGTILRWPGHNVRRSPSKNEETDQNHGQGASEMATQSEISTAETLVSLPMTETPDMETNTPTTQSPEAKPPREPPKKSSKPPYSSVSSSDRQLLKLEVLELERVSISAPALLETLDWTRITTLTILRCDGHEKLWRSLRRRFSPSSVLRTNSKHGKKEIGQEKLALDFPLKIKHIHTDAVSPYLLLFIKDALCPNTLETLFLHGAPLYDSAVHIEAIYRNVIRNHRQSLKKLLIDSSERSTGGHEIGTNRWRKWMLTREMITFITSGRMPQLTELSITLAFKDWHYFLQRLPLIPHIRALHISHIFHPIHMEMKELALQILDIVALRPEIGLSYIGMQTKCYEILEGKNSDSFDLTETDDIHPDGFVPGAENWPGSDTNGDDSDDDDDEEGSTLDSHSELSSDDRRSTDDDESDLDYGRPRVSFRLREILFYDDKIAIFKARHGVL